MVHYNQLALLRKKGKYPKKYKPIFLVTIYRLARAGLEKRDIIHSLGVSKETWFLWQREISEIREVLALVEQEKKEQESFADYLFGQLSPHLQELWRKIGRWEKEKSGVAKIELMLEEQGKHVRQQLYLHALAVTNFSASKACTKLRIGKKTLDHWISTDPEFAELVEQVQWHRGNFYEESLLKLVKKGNPSAVIFANRTLNSERGYGAKVDVNVSGSVFHGVLDLGELLPYLSVTAKAELLEAIRQRELQTENRVVDWQDKVSDNLQRQIAEVPAG